MATKVTLILLALFISLCQKPEKELVQDDIVITTGHVKGWCAGADSLKIEKNQTTYWNYTDCSNTAAIYAENNISDQRFTEITDLLDLDYMKTLDYDACNVCFDGTDYFLSVTTAEEQYTITFGFQELNANQEFKQYWEKLSEEFERLKSNP